MYNQKFFEPSSPTTPKRKQRLTPKQIEEAFSKYKPDAIEKCINSEPLLSPRNNK
jgi:hypothetical protein